MNAEPTQPESAKEEDVIELMKEFMTIEKSWQRQEVIDFCRRLAKCEPKEVAPPARPHGTRK